MSIESQPGRTADTGTPDGRGACEDIPRGELTQADLDAAAELPGARWAHAKSNGVFVGCTLCNQVCQLRVGDTFRPDSFCNDAIAARDGAAPQPTAVPLQGGPVD